MIPQQIAGCRPRRCQPRAGLASAYYHGLILVLGGELAPRTFAENEAYDPKTDRWTTLAPMPHGRHGFGGDAIGDNAYFVGGSLEPGGGGVTDPADHVSHAVMGAVVTFATKRILCARRARSSAG